eukprot:TRINITY_DN84675_c0_g1_i1.p1 TRINITY_DN84675_c0_g1~~TRINITY_DN84675_c0_g1_i1.p1  ORF type:complete len:549 (-),score=79.69 TRINITY_DN84675_c0_g1_i1:168-1595(-)
MKTKLGALKNRLQDNSLELQNLAQLPLDAFKKLEDCMNLPNPQARMAEFEEQREQLLKAIEKTDEIKAIALSDGEMFIAEEQYYLKVSQLENIFGIHVDNWKLLTGSSEDEVRLFDTLGGVRSNAKEAAAKIKNKKRKLLDTAQKDLDNVNKGLSDAQKELHKLASTSDVAKHDARLQDILAQREAVWKKMQDLETEFHRLGKEREAEIRARQAAVQKQEKQAVSVKEFASLAAAHAERLKATVNSCDSVLNAANIIEGVVDQCCAAIESRTSQNRKLTDEEQRNVQDRVYFFYRELYKTLGELKYKKTKKLEEIDRTIRTAHIQLELCIETFDPVAKKHANDKKDMYKSRADTEDEIACLTDSMTRATALFQPIADELDALGIEWIDPRYEVQENDLSRRTQIVEFRAHLAKPEEVKIMAEREDIQRQRQLLIETRSNSPTALKGSSPEPGKTSPTPYALPSPSYSSTRGIHSG